MSETWKIGWIPSNLFSSDLGTSQPSLRPLRPTVLSGRITLTRTLQPMVEPLCIKLRKISGTPIRHSRDGAINTTPHAPRARSGFVCPHRPTPMWYAQGMGLGFFCLRNVAAMSASLAQAACEPFALQPPQCASLMRVALALTLTDRRFGDVFVPAGVSQASVAANASAALALLPLLPTSCGAPLQTFVCAVAFRPCDDALAQPLPICVQVCASARGNCTGTLADARIANCLTATDPSGELYFQDGATCLLCLRGAA